MAAQIANPALTPHTHTHIHTPPLHPFSPMMFLPVLRIFIEIEASVVDIHTFKRVRKKKSLKAVNTVHTEMPDNRFSLVRTCISFTHSVFLSKRTILYVCFILTQCFSIQDQSWKLQRTTQYNWHSKESWLDNCGELCLYRWDVFFFFPLTHGVLIDDTNVQRNETWELC